ncbi:MAG TPA: hypothetical protein VE998_12340 [Terriglobales bacterium]|nr:hypothetical protein [Terriglobales bacterium]
MAAKLSTVALAGLSVRRGRPVPDGEIRWKLSLEERRRITHCKAMSGLTTDVAVLRHALRCFENQLVHAGYGDTIPRHGEEKNE